MGREQSLYWYGMKASLVQILGIIIITIGILLFFNNYLWTIAGTILGIIIIVKGKAMRLQYQMRTGTVIHKGDW